MRIPPPVMVALVLLLAWGLGRVVPLPVGAALPGLGIAVVVLGLGLILWALAVMLRAGTNPRPDKPDAALVEAGPFRFSRNPVYLGLVVVAAGLALRWGDLWGWLAVPASLVLLDRLVIAREEVYLAARFGPAYEAYRRRVRRWM